MSSDLEAVDPPARPLWGPARRATAPEPVADPPDDAAEVLPIVYSPPVDAPAPSVRADPPARPEWLGPAAAGDATTEIGEPAGHLPPGPPPRPPNAPSPPAIGPPPAHPAPGGNRTGPAVLIGLGVVAVLVIGGIALATTRSSSAAPAPGAGSSFPTSQYAAPAVPDTAFTPQVEPTTTTPLSSADGLVTLDPAATEVAGAQDVVALVDRYFTAINNRDYTAWAATVDPHRVSAQPVGGWLNSYRSTQDQAVQIRSITPSGSGSVSVALSFISTQAVADAPASLPAARICWQSTWPVVGGRIEAPERGVTTMSAC